MKENENNIAFAQKSVTELFYAMTWLSGIAILRLFEVFPIPTNIKSALTAICFIALASKGFKGMEFVIKSWQNEEPNTREKYIGTIGNSLITLFFIASIVWAFLIKSSN